MVEQGIEHPRDAVFESCPQHYITTHKKTLRGKRTLRGNMEETSNTIDAGKDAAKLPSWEWVPGMLALMETPAGLRHYFRIIEVRRGGFILVEGDGELFQIAGPYMPKAYSRIDWIRKNWSNAYPDLIDSATVGCFLQLLRDLWDNPYLNMTCGWHDGPYWFIENPLDPKVRFSEFYMPSQSKALSECLRYFNSFNTII